MLKKVGSWIWWKKPSDPSRSTESPNTSFGDLDRNSSGGSFAMSHDGGSRSSILSPTLKPTTPDGGCQVHWIFSLRSDYNVQSLPFPTEEVDVIEEELVRRFAMEFSNCVEFMEINQETRSRIRSCSVTPMRGGSKSSPNGGGGGESSRRGGGSNTPRAPLCMQDTNAATPPGTRRGLLSSETPPPPLGPRRSSGSAPPTQSGTDDVPLSSNVPEDVMTLTLPVNVLLVRHLTDFIGLADIVQDFTNSFSEQPSSVVVFVYDKHPEPVDQLSQEQNVNIAIAVNTELVQRNPHGYAPGSIISLTSLSAFSASSPGGGRGGDGGTDGDSSSSYHQYSTPSRPLNHISHDQSPASSPASSSASPKPPRLSDGAPPPPLLHNKLAAGSGAHIVTGAGGGGHGYDADYSDCEEEFEEVVRQKNKRSSINVVAIDTDGAYHHALTMLSTESFSCVRCHSVALLLYEEVRKAHFEIRRKISANGGSLEVGVSIMFAEEGGSSSPAALMLPSALSGGQQVVSTANTGARTLVGHQQGGDMTEMKAHKDPSALQCVSTEIIRHLENASLSVIEIIIKNLLTAGEQERYLVLNHVSEKFQRTLGRYPHAMTILGNAGFADAEYTAPGGTVEPRLALPVGLLPYCVPEVKRTLLCLQQEIAVRTAAKQKQQQQQQPPQKK